MSNFKRIIDEALDVDLFTTFEQEDRIYVSILSSKEWTVELSYGILQKSYEQDSFNSDLLLNEIIVSYIKKHDISLNKYPIECVSIPSQLEGYTKFNRKYDELNSVFNPPLIVVEGEERCGKTALVQQYCNSLNDERSGMVFWLDFNGGGNDFSQIILTVLKDFNRICKEENKTICIVLDNLHCCGYKESKNIFRFFSSLVSLLNVDNNIFIRLILIQNKNRRICIEKEIDKDICVFIPLTKEGVIKELRGIESDHADDLSLYLNNTKDYASQYIHNNGKWEESKIKLFIKLLVLCKFDIDVKLDNKESKIVRSLMKDVEGLKVTQDQGCRAKLLNGRICSMLINDIGNPFWTTIGVNDYIANVYENDVDKAVYEICEEYFKYTILTLDEYSTILQHNAYYYYNHFEKSKPYMALIELLDYAKKFERKIISDIDSTPKNQYFGNHLGSILFAAETLCFYPDDWEALSAWDKLSEYVNNTFYIDGQNLPEIRSGYEELEKTWYDFCNGDDNNSIENQMELQDIVIEDYGLDIKCIPNLEEKNFPYLLTNLQYTTHKDIDINRFYQTYILALLFEFEVRAPQCRYNKNKVKLLFDKIEKNIISSDEYFAYFYPARVPWVTARLLLALSMIRNSNVSGLPTESIRRHKKELTNYLIKFSYSFEHENRKYRIWFPGTGRWNGILETTMMCTFALKKVGNGEVEKIISEGECYINDMRTHWYNPSSIADGMWAIETLNLKNQNDQKGLNSAVKIWEKLKDIITIDSRTDLEPLISQQAKNDKSLGDSHTAQSLNSLVDELVKCRPQLAIDYSEVRKMTNKRNVFISFDTATGLEYAKNIYENLYKNELFEPYFYRETMREGKWHAQLKNAILMSDSFILLLGEETLSSSGVIFEIKCRLEDEKPILPVVYGNLDKILSQIDNIEGLSKYQKDELRISLTKSENNIVLLSNSDNYIDDILNYIKPN